MKRTQRERIAAQVEKLEAAIDFDELGALHDELSGGDPDKTTLFAAVEKLNRALNELKKLGNS